MSDDPDPDGIRPHLHLSTYTDADIKRWKVAVSHLRASIGDQVRTYIGILERDLATYQSFTRELEAQLEEIDRTGYVQKCAELQAEIERLRAQPASSGVTGDPTFKMMMAEIVALKRQVAHHKARGDRADELAATIAELQAELNPEPDPWHDDVAAWLERHPWDDRIPSRVLLEEGAGVPFGLQDTEAGRRLSKIMTRIGGWRLSNNVAQEGSKKRVHGWIRPRY